MPLPEEVLCDEVVELAVLEELELPPHTAPSACDALCEEAGGVGGAIFGRGALARAVAVVVAAFDDLLPLAIPDSTSLAASLSVDSVFTVSGSALGGFPLFTKLRCAGS